MLHRSQLGLKTSLRSLEVGQCHSRSTDTLPTGNDMSAIVVHPTTPTERSRLLSKSPSIRVSPYPQPSQAGPSTPTRLRDGHTPSSSLTLNPDELQSGASTPPIFPTSKGGRVLNRSAPLRDTISTTRFVLICVGIWSSNFVFAFQSTAIPTLAPGISSGFGHSELASYLGSIFSLTSAAGTSYITHVKRPEGAIALELYADG